MTHISKKYRTTKTASRTSVRDAGLARPFSKRVVSRARQIASHYQLLLNPEVGVGWVGSAVEMPYVFGDGRTPDACVRATQEALTAAVATLLERGERPPETAQSRQNGRPRNRR